MTGPVIFVVFTYLVTSTFVLLMVIRPLDKNTRRFQFSLGMLLGVTTLLAMYLASHMWLLEAIKMKK